MITSSVRAASGYLRSHLLGASSASQYQHAQWDSAVRLIEEDDGSALRALLACVEDAGFLTRISHAQGRSLLHRAAALGSDETLRPMLDALPANAVHIRDDRGMTPLMLAARHGHADVIRTLLATASYRTDVYRDQPASFSWRCCVQTVVNYWKQRRNAVKAEGRLAAIDARAPGGETALWWAAHRGHPAAVTALLEHGANVHVPNRHLRRTPLIAAACENHTEVVRLLCEYGADVHMTDFDGRTALTAALSALANEASPVLVKHLIDAGADLTLRDFAGDEPLFTALKGISNDAMEVLILSGANIHAHNDAGQTLLQCAAAHGNVQIVSYLMGHAGIDINERGERGRTALATAVESGRLAVLERLLQASDIDVDVLLYPRLCTPLFYAVSLRTGNAAAIVRALLGHGANVNARDHYGQTALMQAIRYGRGDLAAILREHGADETPENILGYAAEHMATVAYPFFLHNMFLDDAAHESTRLAASV